MLITKPAQNVFFTADHHFGHANIIKYTKRPFANVDDMDAALITAWNAVVGKEDLVFHLGDFTLGDNAPKYLCRLNGQLHLLANFWHHDQHWLKTPQVRQIGIQEDLCSNSYPVELLLPLMVIEIQELMDSNKRSKPIVLCHYPLSSWDRSHYDSWHLFGHCHGTYCPTNLSMDVGVDAIYNLIGTYRPIALQEIIHIFKTKEVKSKE